MPKTEGIEHEVGNLTISWKVDNGKLGWNLRLKDGRNYVFPDKSGLAVSAMASAFLESSVDPIDGDHVNRVFQRVRQDVEVLLT